MMPRSLYVTSSSSVAGDLPPRFGRPAVRGRRSSASPPTLVAPSASARFSSEETLAPLAEEDRGGPAGLGADDEVKTMVAGVSKSSVWFGKSVRSAAAPQTTITGGKSLRSALVVPAGRTSCQHEGCQNRRRKTGRQRSAAGGRLRGFVRRAEVLPGASSAVPTQRVRERHECRRRSVDPAESTVVHRQTDWKVSGWRGRPEAMSEPVRIGGRCPSRRRCRTGGLGA